MFGGCRFMEYPCAVRDAEVETMKETETISLTQGEAWAMVHFLKRVVTRGPVETELLIELVTSVERSLLEVTAPKPRRGE